MAVNSRGVRIGKGGGFADLEYGLAAAAGVVQPGTPVISTVHPMQLLDEELPWTQHDVPLDIVVTTESIIRCDSGQETLPRPKGIYWEGSGRAQDPIHPPAGEAAAGNRKRLGRLTGLLPDCLQTEGAADWPPLVFFTQWHFSHECARPKTRLS